MPNGEVEVPVMVNGKLRASISVPRGSSRDDHVLVARAHPKVAEILDSSLVKSVMVLLEKMVNFVVSGSPRRKG